MFKSLTKQQFKALSKKSQRSYADAVMLMTEEELLALADYDKKMFIQKAINAELSVNEKQKDKIRKTNILNKAMAEQSHRLSSHKKWLPHMRLTRLTKMSDGTVSRYKRKAIRAYQVSKHFAEFEQRDKINLLESYKDDELSVVSASCSVGSKLDNAIKDHFVLCRASRKNRLIDKKTGIKELDRRIDLFNRYMKRQKALSFNRKLIGKPSNSWYSHIGA